MSTAQALEPLAAALLEPESDDRLSVWNFLPPPSAIGQRLTAFGYRLSAPPQLTFFNIASR